MRRTRGRKQGVLCGHAGRSPGPGLEAGGWGFGEVIERKTLARLYKEWEAADLKPRENKRPYK